MKRYFYILVAILAFSFSGCEKPPQALKPAGKAETQVRSISHAGKLFLLDDVDIIFSDSVPVDEAWITGGKYLLDWVTVENRNDSLFVGNDNRANWLRSYEKRPAVKLNPARYYYIEYDAAGHIFCESTMIRDSVSLVVKGGGGSIEMDVNTGMVRVSNNTGTVDVSFTGYSHLTYLFNGSYGPLLCNDLYSHLIFLTNSGFGDVHARGGELFVGRIRSSGNVYIYGDPEETDLACSGSGQFISVE